MYVIAYGDYDLRTWVVSEGLQHDGTKDESQPASEVYIIDDG